MTSDNGSKPPVGVETTAVAIKFVGLYYPTIRADPKKAHQFYMDDSKFTRIEDNKESSVVIGQQVCNSSTKTIRIFFCERLPMADCALCIAEHI